MTEKKYILTESQLQTLHKIITAHANHDGREAVREIYSRLKPVEPMSDEQIKEIHSQSVVSAGTMWARPVTFARAIEQRIVGELK